MISLLSHWCVLLFYPYRTLSAVNLFCRYRVLLHYHFTDLLFLISVCLHQLVCLCLCARLLSSVKDKQGLFSSAEFWIRRNLSLIVTVMKFEGGDIFCMEQQLHMRCGFVALSRYATTTLQCIRDTPGHTQI